MTPWKRAPLLCAAIAGGIATGWWVRTQGAPRLDPAPADRAWQRGQGDRLVEYFDPACEGSRSVHKLLDQEFARGGFQHIMIPVAIGRGADSVPADALCALPDEQVWQKASTWAQTPPRHPERGMDLDTLDACASSVEAATQHIATLSPDGKVMTPVVEFRGHVYVGVESTSELLAALQQTSTPAP